MITKNINGQNISQAFINAINDSTTPYVVRLVYNNVPVSCDIKSVEVTKGTVASMENFNIGAVISSEVVAHVMNLTTSLKDEIIEVQIGLITDETQGTIEYIKMGEFVVSTAEKTAYETVLTAYGYTTSKTGGDFISPQDLLPPQTLSLANIASQIENGAGVNIVWDSDIDTTAVLDLPMSGITNYQALQILASVVGGYAVDTNDGDIYIGLFKDTVTHSVSAGSMINLPQYEEQDFEITGVYVETAAGAMGSQTPINLVTDSQWLTLAMFSDYEANIVGYTYRPAECGLTMGDPRIEGTDVLEVVNIDGSTFVMPCHKIVHKCTGGLSSEIQSAVATQLENAVATPPPLSEQVTEAMSKANEALEAVQEIGDTAQYFWHTTTDTGAGAGAHITQIPQVDFLARVAQDPTDGGGNTLLTAIGMYIRRGLKEFATFLTNGLTIKTYDSDDNEVVIAHLGYGQGKSETGTDENEPFYTLGLRASGSDIGNYSLAEGLGTEASAYASHAEGYFTKAQGISSHAEGSRTEALENDAHAEGSSTIASGAYSHSEGAYTLAEGDYSHAEGYYSEATGDYSHAGGAYCIAQRRSQVAYGEYNEPDESGSSEYRRGAFILILGNGDDDEHRSNAFTVDWDGVIRSYSKNYEKDTGGSTNAGLMFLDKNADTIAYMKPYAESDGQGGYNEGFNAGTSRDANGTTVWNGFRAMIDANGDPYVTFNQPKAWRTGLGLDGFMVSDTFDIDNITIGASTVSGNKTVNVAKSGYTPLMIQVSLSNATSSGTNVSGCNAFAQTLSGTTATVNIANRFNAQAKVKATITVLYRKNL